ncbi:MAG: hypothetical protein M1830_003021 [Pleopsidium flavum]|nr:MAG: hypothetical protein M1830_003021 [Pleopsidium flavum]
MPNRYSHAFVLNDYEKRGLINATYQEQTHRYQTVHPSQSVTSSSPSVSKTLSPHITPSCSVPTPSISKASPSRPPSTVVPQAYDLGQPSPLNLHSRPTTASASSYTSSSVITQIYNPQTPRSYFDLDSPVTLPATPARPHSVTTELNIPLSPLPTSLQYLDSDYALGSANTTPRTSLEEVVLRDKLLDAIPSTGGCPHDRSHEGLDDSDDDLDGAVPPPIMRRKRDSSYTITSIATYVPRTSLLEQRSSLRGGAQALNSTSAPTTPQGPPPLLHKQADTRTQNQTQTQPQKLKKENRKSNHATPVPPPLVRSRTDLNHEEMQRWKKEVQQANWQRGSWVGALVGSGYGEWRERRRLG